MQRLSFQGSCHNWAAKGDNWAIIACLFCNWKGYAGAVRRIEGQCISNIGVINLLQTCFG